MNQSYIHADNARQEGFLVLSLSEGRRASVWHVRLRWVLTILARIKVHSTGIDY